MSGRDASLTTKATKATKASVALRVASGAITGLFLVSAGLQLNDPDPIGWTAIYLAAAIAAGLGAARRLWWPFAAAVGAVALVWAASFGGRVLASGMLRDLARAMGPGTHAEEAREFLGLAIVVVWMGVLCLGRRAHARPL